jgi:vacuolar-type H+-ATPase subunit H
MKLNSKYTQYLSKECKKTLNKKRAIIKKPEQTRQNLQSKWWDQDKQTKKIEENYDTQYRKTPTLKDGTEKKINS